MGYMLVRKRLSRPMANDTGSFLVKVGFATRAGNCKWEWDSLLGGEEWIMYHGQIISRLGRDK
jgi:hypothetical protein